jgi:hypothetical protein
MAFLVWACVNTEEGLRIAQKAGAVCRSRLKLSGSENSLLTGEGWFVKLQGGDEE